MDNYIEKTQKQLIDVNKVKCQLLIKKLIEIEMTINEVIDFSENEAPKREMLLESIFEYPQILDCFRTQINYCVRLRRVTEEEMEFCKYRTLTKVVDYINYLSQINLNNILDETFNFGEYLSVQDKIVLLRYGFASLALFDIAAGTISATKDTQNLLCLPTGITLCSGETIIPNSFLTQQIINKCISSLVRLLADLKLDQEEFILMKLIIVLGMDSASGEENNEGINNSNNNNLSSSSSFINQNNWVNPPQLLSINGRNFIEKLRDSAHSALYNHSPHKSTSSSSFSSSEAALRFAKLLHILPKLTLISRDLVEHIRMVHTFPSTRSRPTDPLFFDLFGDIFQPNKQNNNLTLISSSSNEQQLNEEFNNFEGNINHQKQNNNFELSDLYVQQQFKNDLISKTKREVNTNWWLK
ncbi:NR LBD domain-containing protein [Meloidogyne graminicola]|uniref:NR LBD domain-containing protein n=1 Tax=Meloidogyne graminicola TaxID=189291 RepID=A0A8S9ZBQ1_9BILA|nr:NR LBD domain-containing protein [Meloidogyne graminicola]